MYPALCEVHGDPDIEGYLFSAFRQIEGQKDYPAWLLGNLVLSGFRNYLTWLARSLTSEQRREAIEELQNKFTGYVRACVGDDVDEAAILEVRAAYEMARDMDRNWRLLF
jgi:hypothetical protein